MRWTARIVSIVSMLGGLALAACAPVPSTPSPAIQPAVEGAAVPQGFAELLLFNDSGWTLIPSNQDVTVNGHPLASLPRETYTRVFIAAGVHVLSLHSRSIRIRLKPGERHYVALGYRPERSWLLPIMGDPVVIRPISEAEASDVAKMMKAQ